MSTTIRQPQMPDDSNIFKEIKSLELNDQEQALIEKIASELHESWQNTLRAGGTTRWKLLVRITKGDSTKEEKWLNGDENGNIQNREQIPGINDSQIQVIEKQDILNTDFRDLHEDWRKENLAAAEFAIKVVRYIQKQNIDPNSSEARDLAGSLIHAAWLKRNKWAEGSDLDRSFAELSKEEQEKDLHQYELALMKALGLKSLEENSGEQSLES